MPNSTVKQPYAALSGGFFGCVLYLLIMSNDNFTEPNAIEKGIVPATIAGSTAVAVSTLSTATATAGATAAGITAAAAGISAAPVLLAVSPFIAFFGLAAVIISATKK